MRYRFLGRTGLRVSVVGLGTGPLGGLYSSISDDIAIALIRRALDLGMNYVDTAPLYGRGRSEELVGRATEGAGDRCIVATKAGYLPDGYDYSEDMTLRGVEDSLRRLRASRLALVQIHDVERSTPEVILGPHGALAALRKLQAEGVVDHIGVSGGPLDVICQYAATGEFETVITHSRYTLLNATASDQLLSLATARGVGIINGGPYASGILASGSGAGAKYSYQDAPPHVVERVRGLETLCRQQGVALRTAALLFSLANDQIAVTIAGATSVAEVEDNAAVADVEVYPYLPIFTKALAEPPLPYLERL